MEIIRVVTKLTRTRSSQNVNCKIINARNVIHLLCEATVYLQSRIEHRPPTNTFTYVDNVLPYTDIQRTPASVQHVGLHTSTPNPLSTQAFKHYGLHAPQAPSPQAHKHSHRQASTHTHLKKSSLNPTRATGNQTIKPLSSQRLRAASICAAMPPSPKAPPNTAPHALKL